MKKLIKLFIIVLSLFVLIMNVSPKERSVTSSGKELSSIRYMLNEKEFFPELIKTKITIASIGDVLIHGPIYQDALTGSSYDFYPMLQKMETILTEPTITTANQESMIGGVAHGLSSYPSFNSPKEVGDALKAVGVDAVVLANNHTLDRGEAIIKSAIQHWDALDMTYVGAYKDAEDQNELRVIDTEEDISVALLAYTYGTNGIPVPEGKEYLVDLIDREKIAEEVGRVEEQADVIVLQLHFGNEYERVPNEEQKELAQFAADLGVDAVIGHHPHVLQPAEWLKGEAGNETLVIYSLGNFFSNQQELYQRIGGVFSFTVEKTVYGNNVDIQLHSPKLVPTYTKFHSDWADYEVVPMHTLTDNELPEAGVHYEEIKAHMSQWMPEMKFPEG